MKRILITVKQKHIRKGIPFDHCNCPIALAVEDRLHATDLTTIKVSWDRIVLGEQVYELPRSARRFISKFDTNEKVTPFAFYLQVAP